MFTVNKVYTDELIAYQNSEANGDYIEFQGESVTFSPQTKVNFGGVASF